jgi:hypothetical protein
MIGSPDNRLLHAEPQISHPRLGVHPSLPTELTWHSVGSTMLPTRQLTCDAGDCLRIPNDDLVDIYLYSGDKEALTHLSLITDWTMKHLAGFEPITGNQSPK